MKKNVLWMILLFLSLAVASCSDNDEPKPADADENFITEFSLAVHGDNGAEQVFRAEISDNIITLTVPYNVDLTGAKANVTWTPSATILPDPSTITNWGDEQVFRVTSYNGDTNEYTYKVVRAEITQKGNVEIKKMADIENFANAGTSAIEGDLIIGTDDGEEITSLEKLSNLKSVSGNIIIKNSFKATDLTGLENVVQIGGLIVGNETTASQAALNLVTMGALADISGDIIIRNDNLQWVRLEKLAYVGGSVIIASNNIESVEFPELEDIEGNFNVCGFTEETKDKYGNVNMGGKISSLTFSKLAKVSGNIGFDYLASLQSISLPELSTVGSIELNSLGHQIKTVDFQNLNKVERNLRINSVRTSGQFMSDATSNTSLESLGTMSKLESVGETLEFMYFAKLPAIPDFSSLKQVKNIHFKGLDNVANALNISNVSFADGGEIHIESWTAMPTVIGSGDQPIDIILQTDASNDLKSSAPSVKGFNSIKNLTLFLQGGAKFDENATIEYDMKQITGDVSVETNLGYGTGKNIFKFSNLQKINGALLIGRNGNTQFGAIKMPNLVDVGGQFYWGPANISEYDFSNLESVGCANDAKLVVEPTGEPSGMLYIDGYWLENNFELPKLTHVGGSKSIYLSLTWSWVSSFSFPMLKTIDSSFIVNGEGCEVSSIAMKQLESVKSVMISNLANYSDFSDFSTPIVNGSITKDNWSVTGCGYNPTYEDMKEGRYKQSVKSTVHRKKTRSFRSRPRR